MFTVAAKLYTSHHREYDLARTNTKITAGVAADCALALIFASLGAYFIAGACSGAWSIAYIPFLSLALLEAIPFNSLSWGLWQLHDPVEPTAPFRIAPPPRR